MKNYSLTNTGITSLKRAARTFAEGGHGPWERVHCNHRIQLFLSTFIHLIIPFFSATTCLEDNITVEFYWLKWVVSCIKCLITRNFPNNLISRFWGASFWRQLIREKISKTPLRPHRLSHTPSDMRTFWVGTSLLNGFPHYMINCNLKVIILDVFI